MYALCRPAGMHIIEAMNITTEPQVAAHHLARLCLEATAMPRCAICGQDSNLQNATDTSYICKSCFELLDFCASFDRLANAVEMPARDERAGSPRLVATRPAHCATPQRV